MSVPRYQKSAPFTIKEKRPRDITFIGRVNILMIGFNIILKSVRQAPTIRETQIGSTLIPEMILVVANTATERIIQCKIIFIIKKII